MFDLEKSIRTWKRSLQKQETLEDGTIADLEAHLRDIIDELRKEGIPEEGAFDKAVARVGAAESLATECGKVREYRLDLLSPWRPTRFLPALLGNYFKVGLRKIKRQKGYSVINVAGLAVGLACCAMMLLWVQHEKSFDRFHANRDSLYRLIKETQAGAKTTLDARTPYPLGEAILGKVPEVVNFSRYQGVVGWEMRYGDNVFYNDDIGTADAAFFEMFSFPFIKGDPKTALADPASIVVSESMARKYFGSEEPLGKVLIMLQGRYSFKVTGVIRDVPRNSHLRFDCLIPIVNFWKWWDGVPGDWGMIMFYTYVQLAPHSSAASAGTKIAAVLNENVPQSKAEIRIQPLEDVHLSSNFEWDLDNYAQGSASTLALFSLAAFGVLLLAMINFMNLATARSANRAKEVGLRKVSGARRSTLIGQFLGESLTMAFMGLALALILVSAGLPLFNALAGKQIVFAGLLDHPLILRLPAMTLLTGLLAGFYPAFFLSAFQPARVLRGGVISGGRRQASLRKSLVVIQFALTIILVMGTAVVNKQIEFIRQRNLGMDTRNVVVFWGATPKSQEVKNVLLTNPHVLSVTVSDPPQLDQRGVSDVSWEGKNPEEKIEFFPINVDPDYLPTFRVRLAEGRFFSQDFPSDQNESLVINETAVRAMGMTSPVGKRVTIRDRVYTVIGVVKDFHQSSLHRPIEPMIIRWPEDYWRISVRISPLQTQETIKFLETTWKSFSQDPDMPFRYDFLDDQINGFYVAERKVEAILRLFSAIALFTACLGLLGLASFLAEKRIKEIGIRKVLGAQVGGLILLQTREFSKWILIAGLISTPAAYYAVGRWLRSFAYHINPSAIIFLTAILATWLVALLAVGFQAIRAARSNPVEALRHE